MDLSLFKISSTLAKSAFAFSSPFKTTWTERKQKCWGFIINLHVQFSTRLLFACQLIQRKCSLCSQGTTRQKVCFVILTQLKKDYNGTDKNASLKHYKHCGLFKITVICFLSSILNRIQPCCLQQLMQDSWTLKTPSLQPYFQWGNFHSISQ